MLQTIQKVIPQRALGNYSQTLYFIKNEVLWSPKYPDTDKYFEVMVLTDH